MSKISLKTKYSVKVPKNVTILLCKKTNTLTFLGPLKKKSLTSAVKIIFLPDQNLIVTTNLPVKPTSSIGIEKAKFMQGTTLAEIKHILVEINYNLYKKLILTGVGYRAFALDSVENQIFLKLGLSHLIYFNIPKSFQMLSFRTSRLFLFGNTSYSEITELAALLRKCKQPEPYKGKGILYYGEKIKLKKGKKI